jgi:hypothetical protein
VVYSITIFTEEIIIIIIIIITKYLATKILETATDSKCRLCKQFDETVEHIISACPILAKEKYVKRHDGVCAQLDFNICKEIGVKLDNKHWYDRVPKSIEQILKVRLPYYGTKTVKGQNYF